MPKSTTLDDLEGPLCTLLKDMSLSEPTTKIRKKMDLHYQQWICSPVTLVSGSVRFMRIFVGFLGQGASNDSRIIENVDFRGLRMLCLRNIRKWGRCYYNYLIPCRLSTDPKIHDLEWPWMAILRYTFTITNTLSEYSRLVNEAMSGQGQGRGGGQMERGRGRGQGQVF